MKALLFERKLARFAASRVASTLAGSGRGVSVGPLRLAEIDEPEIPGPGWERLQVSLAGICGSDLSTLDGRSSRYFEDIVSFPFVPGHEILARNSSGKRVVVEPVLACAARGVNPPCPQCRAGDTGCCTSLGIGHLSAGLQTGFCSDTGGGWGQNLVAHSSQIHLVPDDLSDFDALMVEPTACGVHAALSAKASEGETVALIGAGTLGLTTLASLRRWSSPKHIAVGAKHPNQREWASELGADQVVEPGTLARAVRRSTGGLSPAADVAIDCVGSADSLRTAFSIVRPKGRVVMVGMPGQTRVDLAPLWQKEISLTGAYAYGGESSPDSGEAIRSFELAMSLAGELRLGRLVSAVYPLERSAEAVEHAATAGRRGSVKIAFDPRRKG